MVDRPKRPSSEKSTFRATQPFLPSGHRQVCYKHYCQPCAEGAGQVTRFKALCLRKLWDPTKLTFSVL